MKVPPAVSMIQATSPQVRPHLQLKVACVHRSSSSASGDRLGLQFRRRLPLPPGRQRDSQVERSGGSFVSVNAAQEDDFISDWISIFIIIFIFVTTIPPGPAGG